MGVMGMAGAAMAGVPRRAQPAHVVDQFRVAGPEVFTPQIGEELPALPLTEAEAFGEGIGNIPFGDSPDTSAQPGIAHALIQLTGGAGRAGIPTSRSRRGAA